MRTLLGIIPSGISHLESSDISFGFHYKGLALFGEICYSFVSPWDLYEEDEIMFYLNGEFLNYKGGSSYIMVSNGGKECFNCSLVDIYDL